MDDMIIIKYIEEIKKNMNKNDDTGLFSLKEIMKRMDLNECSNELINKIKKNIKENRLILEKEIEPNNINDSIIIKINQLNYLMDYRINIIKASNNRPKYVKLDEDLGKVITIMIANNYSQVPVMNNDREVNGMITWKNIALKLLGNCYSKELKEYIEKPIIAYDNESLFKIIELVKENDYVLIKNRNEYIKGIVTSSDLTEQLGIISEPILLIGKCEYYLRKIIKDKIYMKEDTNKYVFGYYKKLFENNEIWERLKTKINKIEFLNKMENVRIIRNNIMHFNKINITREELEQIKSLNRLLIYIINEK